MITDKEVQGPGKAYWFDSVAEAESFAEQKIDVVPVWVKKPCLMI